MKRKIITGMTTILEFNDPALFILAMQACAASGLSYPEQSDLRWIDSTFQAGVMETHNPMDAQVWYPYAVTMVGMCIKPHFAASYKYVSRNAYKRPGVEMLDPADWRQNVSNLLADCVVTDPVVRSLVTRFSDQYLDPPDGSEERRMRDAMDERVRQTIQEGTMVFDTKKARKMMKHVVPGR